MSRLITSWVESANDAKGDFPLNNLPLGVFSIDGSEPHCCTAIGDQLLDLKVLEQACLINAGGSLSGKTLNGFMEQGPKVWSEVREQLTKLLIADGDNALSGDGELAAKAMMPRSRASMLMPFDVREFTDFYAGRNHAENVGTMFRGPEQALPPNWLHMPIGYNGRASTVVVSGTQIVRPYGQLKGPEFENPIFAPSRRLDIELEMGVVLGGRNAMGQRVSVAAADDMIFGYTLLNDWSARDIQAWEYQPLGPFQAKAFATSISPWIISKEALEPFRTSTPDREKPLLDYLVEPGPMLYDIELAIDYLPKGAGSAKRISRTNYNQMYYSAAQQIAHHASSGCAMRVGDLIGSGTISGPERDTVGSLLELTWGGRDPIEFEEGQSRTFLEDGDSVTLTGYAQGDGYRIGFGSCEGTVLPAVSQ